MANMRMFYSYGVGDSLGGVDYATRRNAARLAYYGLLVVGLTRRRLRPGALALLGLQWSVPAKRAAAAGDWTAIPLIPVAILSKDLSKVAGAVTGMMAQISSRHPR